VDEGSSHQGAASEAFAELLAGSDHPLIRQAVKTVIAGAELYPMEKVVALILLPYTIGCLVGEETSETLYGRAPDKNLPSRSTQPVLKHALPPTCPKRDCYSGLFILQTFDKPLPIRHLKLDIDHPESLETGSQCSS
jgi:hypothetical protein